MESTESKETLPVEILEKVIRLHRYLVTKLEISLPMARATGMVYFNKFFTNRKQPKNKKYALYAISCLHLATKICECPRSLNKFVEIIYETFKNPEHASLFNGLDGIDKPTNSKSYVKDLIFNLRCAEMDIIQYFNFSFEVKLPYSYSENYIEEILKWHMPTDHEFFAPLNKEIRGISWLFLNDLLFTPYFYIYEPELVALVCINLAFDRIGLPLVSPAGKNWFNVLCPDYSPSTFNELRINAEEFFLKKFNEISQNSTQKRTTPIDNAVMMNWYNFPCDKKLPVPQCPPPPLEMIQESAGTSTAFTKMDADHVPFYPPPDKYGEKNPEFERFLEEQETMMKEHENRKKQGLKDSRDRRNDAGRDRYKETGDSRGRDIDRSSYRDREYSRDRRTERDRYYERDRDYERDRYYERDREYERDKYYERDREYGRDRRFEREREGEYERDRDRYNERNRDIILRDREMLRRREREMDRRRIDDYLPPMRRDEDLDMRRRAPSPIMRESRGRRESPPSSRRDSYQRIPSQRRDDRMLPFPPPSSKSMSSRQSSSRRNDYILRR